MPYAPWISPKSGNYLHSRQVRKGRGRRRRSKRVRRNYSRSAKLLPAAVRISLNEQFSIAPTLFNASVHLYFSLSLSLSFCVCVFFSPLFPPFFPLLSSSFSRTRVLFLSPRFFFPLCVDISFCSLLIRFAPPSPLLCERIRVCPCARGIESPFTLLSISLPRFDGTFDALLYDWLPFFWFFFFSTLFDFGLFFFFPFLLFFFVKRHGGRMIFIKRIMLFEVSILLRLKVKTIGKSEGIFIR